MASSALEQLRSTANLIAVWDDFWQKSKGKRSSGVDWVTPLAFKEGMVWRVQSIRHQFGKSYAFSDLRGVALPKKDNSKYRLICVPTVADRIVQRALLKFIEPRSVSLGIANDVSYGFVKAVAGVKRGTHAARVAAVKGRQQRSWVFKTDISKFFDSIQRDQLSIEFNRAFKLKSLAPLICKAIECEVVARDARARQAVRENKIRLGCGLRPHHLSVLSKQPCKAIFPILLASGHCGRPDPGRSFHKRLNLEVG